MRILFVRHGESSDDVDNQYGGWADFPLTQHGEDQVEARIDEIIDLAGDFEIIYTSPLLRARKTAEILANGLALPVEVMEYVKERNTYGLLSGMRKSEAAEKYPEQVEKIDKGEYVDGSERYEDMAVRVRKSVEYLEKSGKKNLIVVTHGNYLKCLFAEVIGKKMTKKDDAGWFVADVDGGKMSPVMGNGIEWE